MDSTTVADFSLSIGGAAQPASHPPVAAGGVFSPQQQPSLAEHVSDSSSQVSAVPLPLMGTHTPVIVPLSNTHQVVLLKLTNKLSLLANANEAISLWSMCFSLR
jgi:hypothetical protein